jgi:hypothetical protein
LFSRKLISAFHLDLNQAHAIAIDIIPQIGVVSVFLVFFPHLAALGDGSFTADEH